MGRNREGIRDVLGRGGGGGGLGIFCRMLNIPFFPLDARVGGQEHAGKG